MKAIVYEKYGPPDLLTLKEIPKPVPKDDEVLLKVRAASLNAADIRLLRADPFIARFFSGLFRPKFKVLGSDVAGRVEAVGSAVRGLKVGDEVFGSLFESGLGAFAEYACALETSLVPKPPTLGFEEAAALPMAAVTALQGLRDQGGIRPGQQVLVNGASGGVGTFAVQLAKHFGATVTAVCGARSAESARSLGADCVIDYLAEDFTKNGRLYDLILAVNGFHPLSDYLASLEPEGKYVMVGGTKAQMFQALLQGPWKSRNSPKKVKILNLNAATKRQDLIYATELVETSKLRVVIDRTYPLSETAQAFRYLEEGHAKGKVVIRVGTDG